MSGVAVGRGPDHPTDPCLRYAEQIDEYFASRPYLTELGYIQFLRSYGGASGDTPEWYLTFYGFYFSGPFLDPQFYLLGKPNEDGFFAFADMVFRDEPDNIGYEIYHFKISDTSEPGIYVQRDEADYVLTYPTFVEFLQTFIDKKGRMWQ